MYLLDTDHPTLLDRGSLEGERVRERLNRLSLTEVVASFVSYEEQMRGWLALLNSLREVHRQVEVYARVERMLRSLLLDSDPPIRCSSRGTISTTPTRKGPHRDHGSQDRIDSAGIRCNAGDS